MASIKLSAIAIDDEAYVLKDLEQELLQVQNLSLQGSFRSTKDALDFLVTNGRVNVIFSDIKMSSGSGLDAARALSAYCDYLIFVTGYEAYAMEAYGVGADAFLSKPVHASEVELKLSKLRKLFKTGGILHDISHKIFVRDALKKIQYAIDAKDIIVVICNGNYVDIVTSTKKVMDHRSLVKMEEQLDATTLFIKISRSVIVAKDSINYIQENYIYLKNDTHYAIGRTFLTAVRAYMQGRSEEGYG